MKGGDAAGNASATIPTILQPSKRRMEPPIRSRRPRDYVDHGWRDRGAINRLRLRPALAIMRSDGNGAAEQLLSLHEKERTVHHHHASPVRENPPVFWTNGSSYDAGGTMQRGVVVVRPEYVAFLPVAAPMGSASQFAHGFASAKGTLVTPDASRAGYPLATWWELGAPAFDGAIWTAAQHGGLAIPIEDGAVVLKKHVPVTFTSTLGPGTLALDTSPPLDLLQRWKKGVLPFDRRGGRDDARRVGRRVDRARRVCRGALRREREDASHRAARPRDLHGPRRRHDVHVARTRVPTRCRSGSG